MTSVKSSHELYIILNKNGTLYTDKNRDFRIYKTMDTLKNNLDKYYDKKIAVFSLSDVKDINEIVSRD